MDPHSFSQLDPVPHEVNADPKHYYYYAKIMLKKNFQDHASLEKRQFNGEPEKYGTGDTGAASTLQYTLYKKPTADF
jgi:guanylate kinase